MKTKIKLTVCISLICVCLFGWVWPLSNSSTPDTFTSAFGPRDKYETPGLQYDFHNGMDLQATSSVPVYAAHAGYATQHYDANSGNYVKILSGNIRTYYMHLSQSLVNGVNVTEGQQIGISGNSGGSSYHLHYEYREDNDDKHPLHVMPYTNGALVNIEMDLTFDTDFSFELTVNDTELDVDRLDIELFYREMGEYYSTQTYSVNYSEETYIPVGNPNWIILQDEKWKMYVIPESFSSGIDQQISYRIESIDPDNDLEMLRLKVRVYNPNGIDPGSTRSWHLIFDDFIPTSSEENLVNNLPCKLISNYPNPFNPTTTISYSLADNIQNPQIEIYNVKGQKVKTYQLVEKAGRNSIVWNGKDENEKSISSGVYFYRLVNEGKTVQSRKMLMLK